MQPPRPFEQRKQDTLRRLEEDDDAWVATADTGGDAYLVPLSFLWHEGGLILSTPRSAPTARNLSRGGRVRVALGPTRDVTVIEGTGEQVPDDQLPAVVDAFVARHDWDPRQESDPYGFYRVNPRRIQAWREVNELAGRTLMRAGRWLG